MKPEITQAAYAPCPTCKQYSHSIGCDALAAAFNHFQSMIAHPVRGHPMGDIFDAQTQDAAQLLIAEARTAFAAGLAEGERLERERVVALHEAFGAHIQADAYRDTFPDNEDDARQLRKSETWWRLQARAWFDDPTGECALAAKRRAMAEPETQAAIQKALDSLAIASGDHGEG